MYKSITLLYKTIVAHICTTRLTAVNKGHQYSSTYFEKITPATQRKVQVRLHLIGRRQGEEYKLPKAMRPPAGVYKRHPAGPGPTMHLSAKQSYAGGEEERNRDAEKNTVMSSKVELGSCGSIPATCNPHHRVPKGCARSLVSILI